MKLFILLLSILSAPSTFAQIDIETAQSVDFSETKDIYLDGEYHHSIRRCEVSDYTHSDSGLEVIGEKYLCADRAFGPKKVGAYFGVKDGQVFFQYDAPIIAYTFSVERVEDKKIFLGERILKQQQF